ncbi:MAG: phosphoribosylamine--glycine ligase [Solirubrobacteraceae bacterium]|nr:phosphoribosylamine--glycine ligase [Solirubrobacteraceae bacterium]
MKILVVGSGGREHAIVHALARSPQRPELLCAPGNPGIRGLARQVADTMDVAPIVEVAKAEGVDLVVVGPEAPLVAGLVDALAEAGIAAFGPSAAAARLEGSKTFAKEIMLAAGVPTAGHAVVGTVDEGLAAVTGYPTVVKFDGLAAGKGVVIATTEAEARAALVDMLETKVFGDGEVFVEDFLDGEEVSLLALCDGERAVALAPARDFKRALDGDEGANTGGMGAFSPVPGVEPEVLTELSAIVHQPIVDELARRGTPFHGVLYAGLMLTSAGPRVLEYNTRFGDPETQVVLPRLQSDLAELMERSSRPGGLAGATLEVDPRAAVTVVLASRGYPASASRGDEISGVDAADALPDTTVFHAGTAGGGQDGEALTTAGGRVLAVTALGETLFAAREAAYTGADAIAFDGRQLRGDIAAAATQQAG